MFKVGDKVVRKNDKLDGDFWSDKGGKSFAVETENSGSLRLKDISLNPWLSCNFDLYVEPVATPTPKFKVDDKVIFTNAKKKKHETKIKGVFVAYEVEVNKGTILVKEERLSNPPPIPREITVDGVVYREVL